AVRKPLLGRLLSGSATARPTDAPVPAHPVPAAAAAPAPVRDVEATRDSIAAWMSGIAGASAERGSDGEPFVVCRNIYKSYGEREVLRGIDLSVGRGEVVVIMGPSGSGKSTLLRLV